MLSWVSKEAWVNCIESCLFAVWAVKTTINDQVHQYKWQFMHKTVMWLGRGKKSIL